ncbi:hypothetical protein OA2633_04596 [Oceanicaulis sp. HTCC2633]|nr:hypothetical protein OA2633_04596 [Oceanicaulis sp. HTCC2633]
MHPPDYAAAYDRGDKAGQRAVSEHVNEACIGQAGGGDREADGADSVQP